MTNNASESASIELVSPARAAQWLARNKNFRKLDERRCNNYARFILEGNFTLTNDAIVIDSNGNIINGQHRLRACVIANKAIKVMVLRGVNDDTHFDRGTNRLMAQLLASRGHVNTHVLGTAARMLFALEGPGMDHWHKPGVLVDAAEILGTVERHPGLADSIRKAFSLNRLGSVPIFAFVHYVGSRKYSSEADLFLYYLESGTGLTKDSPAYWLRERLIAQKQGQRLSSDLVMRLVVKAWNLFARNKTCRALRASLDDRIEPVEGDEPRRVSK